MTKSLDAVFYPTSIAIAGASPGKSGQWFLDSIRTAGFMGTIYAMNPKGTEVSGLPAYKSIKDIPGPVDFVICCIPAPFVPQLIKDCATKGVRTISMYTSGFSEVGTEEGRQLEKEIVRLAKAAKIRIVGPNCLGVYSPKTGLTFASDFPRRVGKVALMGQSGGNTSYLLRASSQRGVRFSKAVSYGNAVDINETELLEYFGQDPETEIIAAYIEGAKDGDRFHRVLADVSARKPVLILKGGYTKAGGEIAASHTGSLAGSSEIWDSLMRQTGAIRVCSLEEMVDLLVTFSLMPLPKGRNVGIFGAGGGASVLATDELTLGGFTVPRLPEGLIKELMGKFGNTAGMIFKNPIDLSMVGYSEGFYDVIKRLMTYKNGEWFDFGLIHAGFGQAAWFTSSAFDQETAQFRDFVHRIHRETDKPLALVLQFLITNWDWLRALELQRGCSDAGMPVYHSMGSAARAIDRFIAYHEGLKTPSKCG